MVIFWMYDLEIGAAVYPLLISAVFGIIFLILGYLRYKKKHEELKRIGWG